MKATFKNTFVMLASLFVLFACSSTPNPSHTPDINQIVTATFQAMTQEAQQTAAFTSTETPLPEATPTLSPTEVPPTPQIMIVNLIEEEYKVIVQPNQQEETKTDIYIQNIKTGEERFFITLENVRRNTTFLAEYRNGNLYIRQRTGDDNTDNWTDELWRYTSEGKGTQLYAEKGLMFLVSPDENYISINFNADPSGAEARNKLIFLNYDGKVVKKFNAAQMGEVGNYLSLPVKWSKNSKFFWGILTLGPSAKFYYKVTVNDWEIDSYNVAQLNIREFMDSDLNTNTGMLIYSDYPAIFDTASGQKFKDSKQEVTLFLYDLIRNQIETINTSITKSFQPKWLGDNAFEYNNPDSEGRLTYFLDIVPPQSSVQAEATPTLSVLPQAIYFVNKIDHNIYRLATDGQTVSQITFESEPIDDFDISPTSSQVAYVSNNQLIIASLDGKNRQVVVDGGNLSQNSAAKELLEKQISSPLWFPDGIKLAFTFGGLNIYDTGTSQYITLLQNSSEKFESFSASALSPDTAKILVEIDRGETWQIGLYSIPTETLERIDGLWSPTPFKWIDNQIYVIAKADPSLGGKIGVWSINTLDGNVAEIIPDNGYVLLSPEIVGEKIFYLYSAGADDNTSQDVYESNLDGSEQTQVLAQTFTYPNSYTYVLWNPDASSFVGFIFDPSQGVRLELNYTDGRPPVSLTNLPQVIHILPKWGP